MTQNTHLADKVDEGFDFTIRLGFNSKEGLTELILELIEKRLVFIWEGLQYSKGSGGFYCGIPEVKLSIAVTLYCLFENKLDRIHEKLKEFALREGQNAASGEQSRDFAGPVFCVRSATCFDCTFEDLLRDFHSEHNLENALYKLSDSGMSCDG